MPAEESACILAIDLGTSGPKVGLVSSQGKVIDSEFEPVPLSLPPGGGAEQDPRDWWRAIVTATRRLLQHQVGLEKTVAAIACTGQWSGTVAVGRDGEPLMNAVIWMDTRGATLVKELISAGISFGGLSPGRVLPWIRLTGGIPTSGGKDPIAHILFIQKNFPDIYQAYLEKYVYAIEDHQGYLNQIGKERLESLREGLEDEKPCE